MTEEEKAKRILAAGKQPKNLDQAQSTDVLVVLPVEELAAVMEALFFTLEHSTTEDFSIGIRKNMLAALKRLE